MRTIRGRWNPPYPIDENDALSILRGGAARLDLQRGLSRAEVLALLETLEARALAALCECGFTDQLARPGKDPFAAIDQLGLALRLFVQQLAFSAESETRSRYGQAVRNANLLHAAFSARVLLQANLDAHFALAAGLILGHADLMAQAVESGLTRYANETGRQRSHDASRKRAERGEGRKASRTKSAQIIQTYLELPEPRPSRRDFAKANAERFALSESRIRSILGAALAA